MNELQVFNFNQVDVVDSREVAELVGKRHDNLIADIRGYIKAMEKSIDLKIQVNDFFIQSTYKDGRGRELPCYLLTKKGCDMVANKMTGEKGVLFTAAYVTAFEKMREKVGYVFPKDYPSALRALADAEEKRLALESKNKQLQTDLDKSKEWYSIKRVAALNSCSFHRFDWRKLKRVSIAKGYGVKKIFDANYGEVNVYHMSVWESVYPEMEL